MKPIRRGFSLVELLVVMACMTVMFALSSQILIRLWTTVRETREQGELAGSLARIGVQFREDVHRSRAANTDESCELVLEDGNRVAYAFTTGRLFRTETSGVDVVHRESYTLPANCEVRFAKETADQATVIELSIAAAPGSSSQEPGIRNHRLTVRSFLPSAAEAGR